MLKFIWLWIRLKLSTKVIILIQKAIIVIFLVGAVAALGRVFYLGDYYAVNGAKVPQPSEGRIYKENFNHGYTAYLTEYEAFEVKTLLPCLFGIQCGFVIILNKRWKQFSPEKKSKLRLNKFKFIKMPRKTDDW